MANLIRWDPMREMMSVRDVMDQAFEEFFNRRSTSSDGYGVLNLDMIQTDVDIQIQAAMPGINPDDIDISITGDTLTIKGETKEDNEIEEGSYHIREIHKYCHQNPCRHKPLHYP